MKIIAYLLLFTLICSPILSYSAMGNSENTQNTSLPEWTFMVYMDADNSLSYYAPDDLAEMMSYGSNANLNVVVLYDSTKSGDSAIYYIEKGKKVLEESLGEVDMGSEVTLKNFLNWTYHHYPAQHYFLDLWDHGDYYEGVCMDHGDWLTLSELHDALGYFDSLRGKKLDVVGFDACRMGGIEIFYALRDVANYAVASEKDEPASGWPYYRVLSGIYDKNPENASRAVVNAMYDWAKKFYSQNGLSVIMASVNLTRINSFINKFNALLNFAMPVATYLGPEILNATSDVERYELHSVADFYNLMQKLNDVGDYRLSKLATGMMQEINNVTYYKVWDCPNPANGYHARHAHGIGIYFPQFFVSGGYYSTEFAKNTLWVKFLNSFLEKTPIKRNGSANITAKNGWLNISYEANVSYVDVYVLNATKTYSGILKPMGNYDLPVNYGTYTVFIYGYNSSGEVVWRVKKIVPYLREIDILGKIYLNGNIADGAKISFRIGNDTYVVIQNSTGFDLKLKYPKEIWDNSTVVIHVSYRYFSKDYTYKIGSLKGEEFLPVIIRDSYFPTYPQIVIVSLSFTVIALVIIFYLRRFSS